MKREKRYVCTNCERYIGKVEPVKAYTQAELIIQGLKVVCPECHSEELEIASQCDMCGEWFYDFQIDIYDADFHLCKNCEGEVQRDFQKTVEAWKEDMIAKCQVNDFETAAPGLDELMEEQIAAYRK